MILLTKLPSSATLTMAVLKQCAWLLWALSLTAAPVVADDVPSLDDFTTSQISSGDALSQLSSVAFNNTAFNSTDGVAPNRFRRTASGCSLGNLRVRREW